MPREPRSWWNRLFSRQRGTRRPRPFSRTPWRPTLEALENRLAPASDLAITNTESIDPVIAGSGADNLTYLIAVTNNGLDDAIDVVVNEALTLPAGVTLSSFTSSPGTTFVPGTGVWTIGPLANTEQVVLTLVLNVGADAPDGEVILNTATVSSASSDPDSSNNSATEDTTITTEADVTITKTDSPDPVSAGSNLTYTIVVTNTGPSDAQGLSLSDVVPANTTFVSFAAPGGWTSTTPAVGGTGTVSSTNPTLAAGSGPQTFTLVVHVNSNTADGATLSNTTDVSATTTDPTLPNSATTTTDVTTEADLSVTKTDSPDPVIAGTDVTYTITVSNAGPSDAQTVSLSDNVPANTTFVSAMQTSGPAFTLTTPAAGGTGTITADIATLAAGATATFTFVVNVNLATTDLTILSNSATISTTTTDPDAANNSDTETTQVNVVNLQVTKADSPDPVVAGQNLTYTITVTSTGSATADNVSLSDVIPANTTFVSAMQTSGPAFTLMTPAVGGVGTFSASATSLAGGATATFTLVVNVNANTPDGTVLSNIADVTTTSPDQTAADNSDTETTAVDAEADLSVTKSDSPDPVIAGTNLTYTITVSNAGPSDAQTVSLSDSVPANTTFVSAMQTSGPAFNVTPPPVGGTGTLTATIATLAAGATATFTFVVNVNLATTDGAILSNTATIGSTTTDPTPANDSATATTTVRVVNLQVTKTDSPDPVVAGQNLTYTITVTSTGSATADNVSLSDAIPTGTTFVSAMQTSGPAFTLMTPAVGGVGTFSASAASLAGGATATFTLVVNVNANTPDGTVLSNTASVMTTSLDQTAADNSDTETTTVDAESDLSVTKTDSPDPVIAGTNLTYTITVSNAGPSDAQTVSLSDVVPANTTFVSLMQNSGPAFNVTPPPVGGTGTLTATIATLAAGATATFTFVVNVNASAADGSILSNTAAITSTTTDPVSINNSDIATTTVDAEADLSVLKTDSPDPVVAGTNLSYTLTISNAGPGDAQNAVLSDLVPAGTTFVSLTQTSGPAASSMATPPAGGTGTASATFASLAAGATATFTFVVRVNASTLEGTILTNTADVTTTTTDPDLTNNADTETTGVIRRIDLVVTKSESVDPVSAGSGTGNLTYVITVTNAGPSDASGISVSEDLTLPPAGVTVESVTPSQGSFTPTVAPDGTWTVGELAAGASATLTVVLTVGGTTADGAVVSDTATVTAATETQINTGKESATESTTVVRRADMQVTKSGPASAAVNGVITYTVTVTNAGPGSADSVVLSDLLPARTVFVSQSQTSGPAFTLSNSGNQVTNTIATMAPGATATFNISVFAPNPGNMANTAIVDSATIDLQPGNDQATTTTAVGNQNQRWIAQVYLDLLNRQVGPRERRAAERILKGPGSPFGKRFLVTAGILASRGYKVRIIQETFVALLGRRATPGEVRVQLNKLNSGGTVEQLRATLLGSPEYFRTQGGGTNQGWAEAVYDDVVGRPITANEAASVHSLLAQGNTRTTVAAGILNSQAAQEGLVRKWFSQFLGRQPESSALAFFVSKLRQGRSDESIIAAIVASPEYFQKV